MSAFWCWQAIVGGVPQASVRIEHAGGTITSVEAGVPARDQDARLAGLVTAGFANAHSHAFHRALRGRTHADGGSFWTWREQMYRIATLLTPDAYYELATAVFAEMALAGITLVGEFHYVHHQPDGTPYDRDNAMAQAVIAAAERAGIRITLLDTLYLRGGLDADGVPLPLSPAQARFGDGSLETWQRRHAQLLDAEKDTEKVRVGAAVHSLRAVDPAVLPAFAELTQGIPVHAHVSEQPAENDQVRAAYGRTPTEVLADVGILGPLFTAVHGTHLTEKDIGLLAERGSSVCLCPTTERDLADGIGPAAALHQAGVRLCLGTDQNAIIDMFEEMRGLEMDERLASARRGRFTPAELLTAATSDGYASLGWEGGSVAPGRLCDLVAISATSPRTAGASLDQLWFAAGAADITSVVVGGRVVVEQGQHRLGDVGAFMAEALRKVGVA